MHEGATGNLPLTILFAVVVQITPPHQPVELVTILDDRADDDHRDLADGTVTIDHEIFIGNRVKAALQLGISRGGRDHEGLDRALVLPPIDLAVISPQRNHQAAVHAIHGTGKLGIQLLQGLFRLYLLEKREFGNFRKCIHCATTLLLDLSGISGWLTLPLPAWSES
ncbi:hypothetical protein D3C81_1446680 [compost metagenome]